METEDYNVLGIDLGTTNSCVAVWKNGQIAIVPNEVGKRTTPSMISFLRDEILIGNAATKKMTANYRNTVYGCKRLIGRKVTDKDIASDIAAWPFRVVGDDNNNARILIETAEGGTKPYSPEEISGMVLRYLRTQAEAFLGHSVTDAVITIPAYFNEIQRKATSDAAQMAGLNVLKLLDEPTAAAIAYHFEQSDRTQNILVYDLGGGTFDVSILQVGDKQVKMLANDGDNHLGGEDFDRNLMNYLFFQYEKQKGEDVTNDRQWCARMHAAAESCKLELSVASSSLVEFDNSDFTYSVSRFLFENLNKDLFNRTIAIVERTIEKANLTKDQIDDVVLVGGSTRIPRIQRLLNERFANSKICKGINADEAVAMGAVIFAAVSESQKMKQYPSTVLLSLGVEVHGGIMLPMIPRGSTIPSSNLLEFTIPTDYQEAVEFRIVMGERLLVRDNMVLGTISFNGLPLCRTEEMTIKVKLKVTPKYHLLVEVEAPGNHHRLLDIPLDCSISPATIQQMVNSAQENRAKDEEMVKRHQEMNILECVIEEGYLLLHSHDSRMTDEWIQQMSDLLGDIREWMKRNEDADIHECQEREQLIRRNILGFGRVYSICFQPLEPLFNKQGKSCVFNHLTYSLKFFFSRISSTSFALVVIGVPGP